MEEATHELDKKIFHLKTLNDVSQEIVFLKDPQDIIPHLLLMVMGTYGSMQGMAFLLDDSGNAIEVFSGRGVDDSVEEGLLQFIKSKGDTPIIDIDHGMILGEDGGKESGNDLLTLLASQEFSVFMPIILKKEFIGALALGEKLLGDPYSSDDMELLDTLVSQGAVSVENARLHHKQLAQERVRRELEIANDIQLSFLPSQVATVQGLDLAAFFLPAKEVGGDFYDFIELPDDKLGIVIADVAGKGIPAALYMALSRALIRACSAHEPTDITKAVLQTNMLIQECSAADIFVTLFYAIYDPASSRLRYVRAGHNFPILYKQSAGQCLNLEGKGVALGMFADIPLEEKEILLEEGDIVVFYTDGVTEAINSKKEEFGTERLTQLLAASKDKTAAEVVDRIQRGVVEFAGDEQQFDDVTLVVLKKTVG
ncbi:MAG: GAF domain-containing SpoIIE family protein phosphatase [Thermodesulfobacteriota bacterium]